jgi:hypothetical protein
VRAQKAGRMRIVKMPPTVELPPQPAAATGGEQK